MSIYAVVQDIGKDSSCKDYVYDNFIRILKEKADSLKIDESTTYYKTFGELIYQTIDELEMGYVHFNPGKRRQSGACIFVYIMIGNKLFTVNLGGFRGYLVQGRKVFESNIEHSNVKKNFLNIFFREMRRKF